MNRDFDYFDTLLPQIVGSKTGAIAPTIVPSAAYGYESAQEADAIFSGEIQKPFYARMGNPTNAKLESVMSEIDGGVGAIVTSSGMGAISMVLTALLKSKDEVLCIGGFFGGTYALMKETLPRFGIKGDFCDVDDFEYIESKLQNGVAVVMVESVGNPNLKLPDLQKISDLCNNYNTILIVDNTATPLSVQPLKMGADIVVYSSTKNISGHSASLGGVALFNKVEPSGKLNHEKYSHLQNIVQKLGERAFIGICKKRSMRDFGMSANAFGSFLTLLGIETLSLRMKKVLENIEKISSILDENLPKSVVRHPSLSKHEHYQRYRSNYLMGCGSLMTLELGDQENAFKFLNATKLITQTANIGDNRTLALHMKSTIYKDFDEDALQILGITDGLVRVSVGLENPSDIANDLIEAFNKCCSQ